jgi:threonyl-tRNA synthetase
VIRISLPDSLVQLHAAPPTGTDILRQFGAGTAPDALAMRVNGVLRDLSTTIEGDAEVEIIDRQHPEALGLIRHDAAHLMAEAVKELYPDTEVTIGPAIENGFYYDFARSTPFSEEDLAAIEGRMCEIVARNEPIEREVWSRDNAIAYFEKLGENYKVEIIRGIPANETLTIYR